MFRNHRHLSSGAAASHFACKHPTGLKPTHAAGGVAPAGRHLLEGNPLVKELNIVGHSIVPNVILPKPAVSVNIAKPTKQQSQPKININGNHGVRPRNPLQLNGGMVLCTISGVGWGQHASLSPGHHSSSRCMGENQRASIRHLLSRLHGCLLLTTV